MASIKIVVTVLNNAPIIGATVKSVLEAINCKDFEGVHTITNSGVVGRSEGESFLRGLFDAKELDTGFSDSSFSDNSISTLPDIIVCVRNGVEFSVDTFKEVVESAIANDGISAAATAYGKLFMHGSVECAKGEIEEPITGVKFLQRPVSAGAGPYSPDYTSMCLAAFKKDLLQGYDFRSFIGRYSENEDGSLDYIEFDNLFSLYVKSNSEKTESIIAITDAQAIWHGCVDIHQIFHSLAAQVESYSKFTNPADITVDAKALLGDYLAAYTESDINKMHAAFSNVAITIMNTFNSIGSKIDTSKLDLNDLIAIGLSGAPAAAEEVIPVPSNVSEFKKK